MKRTAVQPLCHEGPRQGLHHLVVHGAAKQRVGVGNDGNAARGRALGQHGGVAHRLDGAGGAGEGQAFGLGIHENVATQVNSSSAHAMAMQAAWNQAKDNSALNANSAAEFRAA